MAHFTIRINRNDGTEVEVLDITEAVQEGAAADQMDEDVYALCLWENFQDANPGADVDLRQA